MEAETYDLTDEMAEKVKTKIHELMSMSPYVGGLQSALKENQWKTFVWCYDGMEALGTDSETDSTDVNHLDGLKANQSYFMQLPDRETSGEVVSEGHLQMLKALQQLLNLPGPRANRRANMQYCEFTSLPADTDVGLPVNKARPRGDIITFINCSDSKLSIVTADKKEDPVFDCGPWSMFTVDDQEGGRLLVGPVNKARLYIALGHMKGENVKAEASKMVEAKEPLKQKAASAGPGKTRAKRGEIEKLHVGLGDASTIIANRDAQMNGAAIRWLKANFAGGQSKLDAYLGVKGVAPEVAVHTKLSKSVMLHRNEYELGFAYRDAGKMETAAFRTLLLAIVRTHPGSAMNWAHTPNLRRGMLKHIIHVEGWEPQPALHGKDETISATEHAARRKKIINVTDAPLAEALRAYVAAMRALIPAELLAKVDNPDKTYDLTVNFSTLPQPQHHDDHDHDGCSGLIVNHYLHKPAVVIFADNLDHDKLWHHWMAENHVYMFCRFLRMQCSHGVYPQFALNDKGSIPKQPSVNKDTLDVCKMTTTIRIGDCTQDDVDAHDAMLAVLMADEEDDKAEDDDDDVKEIFTTPPTRRIRTTTIRKKIKVAKVEPVDSNGEEEEEKEEAAAASVPGGWSTSGTMASYRDGQWVRHEKVWRDSAPTLVLKSGATFSLGRDFTKSDVLVLAIGVFHQVQQNTNKKRVTAMCSFKKDGDVAWDAPQFHSASAIIDCAVAVGLEFASVKGAKPFSAEKVDELCGEHSGRDIKNSAGFWGELQNTPTSPKTPPKSSKRLRSGPPEDLETQKQTKIAKTTAVDKVPL